MLNLWSLVRSIRRLHSYRAAKPVDESLRGWNHHTPPLKPRAYLELSIADVAYRFCPTKRDLWLRRKEGIHAEPNEAMKRGSLIHTIFHETSREVAKLVLSGYSPWDAYEVAYRRCLRSVERCELSERLCKEFAFMWSTLAAELGSPIAVTEFIVDGTPLGLSRSLRVDAVFEGSIVVELKYGGYRHDYAVAVTGYALALESYLEIPIDFALVITVNGDGTRVRVEPIYVDDTLRQEFIEARDEAIDILLSDVEPPKAPQCPSTCPYRRYCLG